MVRVGSIGFSSILGCLLALCFLTTPAAAQIDVTPELPAPIESSLLITSYQIDNGLPSYVQIYNNSSNLAELEGWTLNIGLMIDGTEVELPISLSGYLEANSWMVVGQAGLVNGADSQFSLPSDLMPSGVVGVSINHDGYAPSDYLIEDFVDGLRYDLSRSSAGNYTKTSSYQPTTDAPLTGGGLYVLPQNPPFRVVAVAANARNCSPVDQSDDCFEFVKIQNLAAQSIDLSQYRLRTGHANQSDSINNTFALSGLLDGGQFLSVAARNDGAPFDLTASSGNAWIQDKYGLTDYSDTVVSYQDIGGSGHIGHAWAYDSDRDTWDWARSTLQGANDFSLPPPAIPPEGALKPCNSNQYRSLATNRCRLLSSATSSLKPCDPNQYRSTETNRCRLLSSAASTLKPCRPDQYRSPETNRCRSSAGSSSSLKPCRPNQERNPDTNRCRKVRSPLANTAFAVEPLKAGTKEFVGWWALGGITLLGLCYAGWEWRAELTQLISRFKITDSSSN